MLFKDIPVPDVPNQNQIHQFTSTREFGLIIGAVVILGLLIALWRHAPRVLIIAILVIAVAVVGGGALHR